MADSVMSVSGVPCLDVGDRGSGDALAFGVGKGGCSSDASSGAIETRETLLLRAARASLTLLRFGAVFFPGDNGSSATLSGGLKTSEGSSAEDSRDSLALACLPAVVLRLEGDPPVVLRLGEALGAGVNSSSSSSSSCCWFTMLFSTSEPSSSSTTTFRRAAALRDGRAVDSTGIVDFCCDVVVSMKTLLRDQRNVYTSINRKRDLRMFGKSTRGQRVRARSR